MATLYDYDSEKKVTVPDAEVADRIKAGTHTFIKGSTVHVFDEGGQIYNLPADKAPQALAQGYRYATGPEVEQERLKEYIDSNPTKSGLLGVLRTMTFGMSDQALQSIGVPQEVIRLHREINPTASLVGEIGGLVSPGSITGAVARGVSKSILRLSPQAVRTSRIASGLVTGGAEGLISTVPMAISDSVLDMKDAPTVGEHLMAGLEWGAATGGLIGSLSRAVQKGQAQLAKAADYGYFRSLGARKPELKRLTAGGKYKERVYDLGKRLRELEKQGQLKVGDIEEMSKQVSEDLLPETGKRLNELLKEIQGIQRDYADELGDVLFKPKEIAQRMRDKILVGPLDPKAAVPKALRKKIQKAQKLIDEFENLEPGDFVRLEELKRQYQYLARQSGEYGKVPTAEHVYRQMASIIREEAEQSLIRLEEKLGVFAKPNAKGVFVPQSLVTDFIETKGLYGDLASMDDILREGVMRQQVNNMLPLTSFITGGGVGSGLAAASDSLLTGGALATGGFVAGALLRKYAKENGELLMARAASKLSSLGGALDTAGQTSVRISKNINRLIRGTTPVVRPEYKDDKAIKTNFGVIRKGVAQLSDPTILQARVAVLTEGMDPADPITQSVQLTAVRSVLHLAQNLPQSPLMNSSLVPDLNREPTMDAMRKFMRRVEIVNDPVRVLEHIAGGTLTTEHMEALKAGYPAMYQSMLQLTLAGIADSGTGNLTLQQRMALSKFVGATVDPSMKNIAQLQDMIKQQTEPTQQRGRVIRPASYETQFQASQVIS